MIKRKSALLLLALVIFTSGCSAKNKDHESSLESNTYSSVTNSATLNKSTVANVTDPYGNPIYEKDKTNFPLYAALPSDNIYLYGIKPYGMVLYQDGKGTYFNWPGLTPRQILPKMTYYDYNGDEKKELAVILYCGSGTGYSKMDLHILNIISKKYNNEYTDNTLSANDINKWFDKSISAIPDNDKKTITVNFNGQNYLVNFSSENSDLGIYNGITYGDVVEFKFSENKIIVDIAIGFTFTKMAAPTYFGTVEATVNFNNNDFTLSDYTFIVNNKFK